MFYISRCLVNVKKRQMEELFFEFYFHFLLIYYLAVVRNVKLFTVYNTMICNGLFTFYAAWVYEKFNYTTEKIYNTS